MKEPQNLKEITKTWVVKNFDIDAERKTKKNRSSHRRIYDLMEDGTYPFDQWSLQVRDELLLLKKDYPEIPHDAAPYITFDTEHDYGYGCCDGSTYRTVEVYFEYEVAETDDDVIKRIMAREKQKIRRKREKEKQDAADLKRANEEQKLMRQLMRKYKVKEG